MKSYQVMLEECEAEIRAGRPQRVAALLSGLNPLKIPRGFRLPIANICRRANLYSLGIRVLAPLVHPKGRTTADATPAEASEYGVLLNRVGATREALALLERIDPIQAPSSLLYRSFCHFSFWDYLEPIELLKLYTETEPSDYMRFVGRVNLALAYAAASQNDAAIELTGKNIEYAREHKHTRLLGNCYETRAQVHIAQGDVGAAEADLNEAGALLDGANTQDYLFIRKWQALLEGLKNRDVAPILAFQAEARKRRVWESVRDADHFALKIEFSDDRFHRLIFGTPYRHYREMVCREHGRSPSIDRYIIGPSPSPCFDVETGEVDGVAGKTPDINSGKKPHQLIEILLRDLYRPLSIASLFGDLFPDDYYDADFSPPRVHQAIFRARRWFETSGFPVVIGLQSGYYRLRISGDFSFAIPLERQAVDGMRAPWLKLTEAFASAETFSQSEARDRLGLTRSSFQRLSRWAIAQGLLERIGNTTATSYRVIRKGKPSKAA